MVEPSAVRASGLKPRRLALAIALAGMALIALALPQFMSALARASGDRAFASFAAGEALSAAAVERALRSRTIAVHWWPRPAEQGDLALLQILQARALDPVTQGGQRRLLLERAVSTARGGLSDGPSDPILWMRLAESRFLRNGLNPGVAVPLLQSMRLGPTRQTMILPRLELGFILYSQLDETQREALYRQVRLAALWQPEWLVAHARQRHALGIVRRALAATPDRRENFDAIWERTR